MPLDDFQCLYLGNETEIRVSLAKLPGLEAESSQNSRNKPRWNCLGNLNLM